MPKVLLYEDLVDKQTGIVTPAGSTVTLHPSSPAYKRIIEAQRGENIVPLPEDVPGYKALKKGGIDSVQALLGSADRLTEIKGIGEKTAEEVNEFLQSLQLNTGE